MFSFHNHRICISGYKVRFIFLKVDIYCIVLRLADIYLKTSGKTLSYCFTQLNCLKPPKFPANCNNI